MRIVLLGHAGIGIELGGDDARRSNFSDINFTFAITSALECWERFC